MEEAIGERHTKATCELVDLVTGKGKPCLARFGSLADLRARIGNVRLTPKSGHAQRRH
jgi:hypothetical protein